MNLKIGNILFVCIIVYFIQNTIGVSKILVLIYFLRFLFNLPLQKIRFSLLIDKREIKDVSPLVTDNLIVDYRQINSAQFGFWLSFRLLKDLGNSVLVT